MNNKKIIKASLLSLGLSISTISCEVIEDTSIPEIEEISNRYSNVDNYYKYIIQDGETIKLYNSKNVYILFDKDTYFTHEYLYNSDNLFNLIITTELYDLPTEEMITYSNGIDFSINSSYYEYLMSETYQVNLNELSDYIEGYKPKSYYTLDEIRELEPVLTKSLKKKNKKVSY